MTLAWDTANDSRVTGYRVYYGTSSGAYLQAPGAGAVVSNTTQYSLTGLPTGKTYYFSVTSVDGSGTESPHSNEVSKYLQ